MAHLVFPLMEGLSRLPLVLDAPPPHGSNIPPPQLMLKAYLALNKRARDALVSNWENQHPALAYYPYPPQFTSHLFMGLDKFVVGRIYQMRSGKSYLAAYHSWWSELPNDTCPGCGSAPETLAHAILHCPSKSHERSLLLGEVTSVDEGSPLWTSSPLLRSLCQFITATHTGFPPEMYSPSPLPLPSSAPSSPPADD